MTDENEQTFIMVKPDGVDRGYIGTIIQRFEKKGFKLIAMKLTRPSEQLITNHYKDMASKHFFKHLVQFMTSGPVVAMVWKGLNVVRATRRMIGCTNTSDSAPGTIRGDLCMLAVENVHGRTVHGSDTVEDAIREIGLWFENHELVQWTSAAEKWVKCV